MRHPATKYQQINIESGRRILVTSDIHGHLSYLKNALEKVSFSYDDILVIVGDVVEKGPDSLGTLRYVMELCERGNVIFLIGNVDALRLRLIDELCEDNVGGFYNYLLSLREWNKTSFYDELAGECGYTISSPEDILLSKNDVLSHFEKEFDFLADLPTVVETQKYVFVHGGLWDKEPVDNACRDIFELTKFDDFMNRTDHVFDKYVVVGHWPVSIYNTTVQQLNPIINRDKRIISIDGGCGVKSGAQLNVLIIPDIDCAIDDVHFISYDDIPTVIALEAQEASADSIHIHWLNHRINMLDRGEEFSYIEHVESGRKFFIHNSYLKNDTECWDYTDYELPVDAGDKLSLIFESSKGCMAKKNGVIGWYFGKYDK